MPTRDPVSLMCAEMGLPAPHALMREARQAASPTPRPATRPSWPPRFESQLDALVMADKLQRGNRVRPQVSAADRSRKASEVREQAAEKGVGWGGGTALATPATKAVLARPKPTPELPMKPQATAAPAVYEWRGHSVGYRAWCLLSELGPMYEVRLLAALDLPSAKLGNLLDKPLKAGVVMVSRGVDKQRLWSIGKTPSKPPASAGTRLGVGRREVA